MNSCFLALGNADFQVNLAELRWDLGSFFQVKAKGALVRARFSMLKEIDAPSSFFFGLERQSGEAKGMHCLRLYDGSDGRVTSVVGRCGSKLWSFILSCIGQNCVILCVLRSCSQNSLSSLWHRD